MKNNKIKLIATVCLAYLGMTVLLIACKKDNGSTNFGINPGSQANMTNIALNMNGKLIEGEMPTASMSSGNPITINSSFSLLEVSGGTQLLFPISTNRDSTICKVYMQVKNANTYWEAKIDRDTFGQLSIIFFIPKAVNNNQFPIVFSVADCAGNISQQVNATISVTDHPTLIQGANGTPRFNLQFSNEEVDFDIHVLTPFGNEIYFSNRTADNGELDFDSICEHPADENIFWQPGTAPSGTYKYWVHFYGACNANSASYILRVFNNSNIVQFHTGTLTNVKQESQHYSYLYP